MKPSQDQSCQLEVVAALVVLLSQERKCECMSQCIGHSGACPRISLIGLSLLAAGGTMYTACTSQALESGFMNLPPVANSIALELHNVPMLEPQELKRLLVHDKQGVIVNCSCMCVIASQRCVTIVAKKSRSTSLRYPDCTSGLCGQYCGTVPQASVINMAVTVLNPQRIHLL